MFQKVDNEVRKLPDEVSVLLAAAVGLPIGRREVLTFARDDETNFGWTEPKATTTFLPAIDLMGNRHFLWPASRPRRPPLEAAYPIDSYLKAS